MPWHSWPIRLELLDLKLTRMFFCSHAQYASDSLWVCCLRPWLVICLQINSQQLVFAAAIYPLRLTDICAAHLSYCFSCIHQSGVGGEAPRLTGMLEEACRTDALLRGFVTLNITQPSPIGTRGKISCQPGEWLLVYRRGEVGKSLMVLWDGLWLFSPSLITVSRSLCEPSPSFSFNLSEWQKG